VETKWRGPLDWTLGIRGGGHLEKKIIKLLRLMAGGLL
jgi:hypothetical protein